MDNETFVTFDDYKDKHFGADASTDRTDDEILEDAENILKLMSGPK